MAKLQISGQVLHNDLSPAANATVEIWELDLGPGGSNDKILSRKTDAQGRFSGLSSDWADREGTAWGVPVPDILNLEFRVKLEDGRTHKGPFITTHGTSVPIVFPYPPPKPVQKPNRDLVQVIYLSDGPRRRACTVPVQLKRPRKASWRRDWDRGTARSMC